jgi:hypothetical protein
MHISITIEELIELALLGRQYVVDQQKQNVVTWLGALPPSDEITKAGENLLTLNKGDQVIHLY